MTNFHKPLVVAILGPTASGKTAAALEIARYLPSEIISVDSALVYKDMNIGTAKPGTDELARVPHHLVDVIDPSESYSAAEFRENALKLITEIRSRHKLPLLVGGTMMYFRALTTGLAELPSANPAIRAQLDQEAEKKGWPALHARLTRLDPETAARLKTNDSQRIQRALEIIEISGQTVSELLLHQPNIELPFDLFLVSLEPSDRSILHERIATRFNEMLEGDKLIEEVKALRERGDLHLDLPSMRCVGYRQTWQYLNGEFDRETLRDKGIAATRQLAKRQLTWLRSMPDRVILDCLDTNVATVILDKLHDKAVSEDLYYL